jgi:hypothetical protein
LTELQALAAEPLDPPVLVGRIAHATLLWLGGEQQLGESRMRDALAAWHAQQQTSTAANDLERDVAAIRALVFQPKGGAIFGGGDENGFSWPSMLAPFALVDPSVRVRMPRGEPGTISLVQPLPHADTRVLFLDAQTLALLERALNRLGGTRHRPPAAVMERPNQPVGTSLDILAFWSHFFAGQPGHWAGWVLETYPILTRIEFFDEARTRAGASVTIGYGGVTVLLEKRNGAWVAIGWRERWVT